MPFDHEEPTALPSKKIVICKVLILTHEATKLKDTDDYFARKFSPVVPFYIMSRSYKMSPPSATPATPCSIVGRTGLFSNHRPTISS